jgi:cytolysin-activating lysine-acyltransferase
MATNDKKTNGSASNNAELKSNNSELQKQAADVRQRIHAAVGQVVLALTVVPRYRHQSIADLQNLVLEPLMRDRIAIATPAGSEGEDNPGGALAGIAFWATVSDEVDAKIREQIKGGSFPVRLKPDEWTSGEHVWLLDVVAPSQKMASSVLANFKQVVKQSGDVRIHPMVARQVDPELLKKMGAAVDGGAA